MYDLTISDTTTFTATYNSTITDTCTVYSCLLVDYATTNKHNDIWVNSDIFTRGNDGTVIYYQNTGSSALQRGLASKVNITRDVAIDVELVDCTFCRLQVGRYATGSTSTYEGYNFQQKGVVHFEIRSTGTYVYLNGTLVGSDTSETNLEQVTLIVYCTANTTTRNEHQQRKYTEPSIPPRIWHRGRSRR